MTAEEAIRVLKAHEAEIRARGVRRLALCGSTARGDARPDSDVDVLVSVAPDDKFSLIDQASLQVRIQDWIGHEVDVLIEEDLKPKLRAAVERDRVDVF